MQYEKTSTLNQNATQKNPIKLTKPLSWPRHWIEREREVYPISFIYVWTTFKHQVQDLYAPQNVLVFRSDRRPKPHFRHEQGYHWLYALICSFIYPQKATFEVNGVEHQKTANNEKNFKPNNWFSEVIKKTFATTFNQPKLQQTKT